MYNNFNQFGQYQADSFNQRAQIQNINPSIPTQVQCYFVSSEKDMEKIQPALNVIYIGINQDKHEVYFKSINNGGLIDINKYTLVSGEQEKNEFAKIMERLDKMENNFSKIGGNNANNSTDGSSDGSNVHAGENAESPTNATV